MTVLRRLAAALLPLLLPLLLAACAAPGPVRGTMHLGMDDAPEGVRLVWPAAPEVPRFLYTGTLTGEPNFRSDGAGRGAIARLGRWIAGLDGSGETPLVLQRPAAVIGDDNGRIYVSDASRQAVFVFDDRAGELLLWEMAEGRQRFVSPVGLALAPGRVFVADAELGAVFVLDGAGAPLGVIGRGKLQRPTGIARDAARGLLYVADTYAHDIKVFDDAGALVQVIGRRGDAEGEFNYPSHLAFAGDALYVTDTMNARVQVIGVTASGSGAQAGVVAAEARSALGRRGLVLGELVRPKGVGVDTEGNVYVIESFHDTLLVFSPSGEFLMPIGGTGTATGRFYLPSGVWVDSRNRVHIADMFNGRIVLFQFLGGG